MTTAIGRSIPPQSLVDLINPVVRSVLQSPLHRMLDRSLLVIHLVGRRSGDRYDIPVGYVELDQRLLVVTQHTWRINLRGRSEIEATYRGRRQPMHGILDEDPSSAAKTLHRVFESVGWRAAQRRAGLKIHIGRIPCVAELEAAVREFHLAIVSLTRR